MFDKLLLKCPNCMKAIEFQSKGGKCILDSYSEKNVPWNFLLSINGEIVKCSKCLKNVGLKIVNLPLKPEIKLHITKEKTSHF